MEKMMTFDEIKGLLPKIRESVLKSREILLANLVMIGEVPAPTFEESERVKVLEDRFLMAGLQNCSVDEKENAFGILSTAKASEVMSNILLVAHVDTLFEKSVDHTVSVQPDRITGSGLGDNSLGLAVLATLPIILEDLGIDLHSNLIMMGATRSLGRGNLEGLKFFLDNTDLPINTGICVEGLQLGRLSYSSIGMLRGEIRCTVPDEYDWAMMGTMGAIHLINEVITKLCEIPLPRKPKSSIILGTVKSGASFNKLPLNAILRFEIRSEAESMVLDVRKRIEDIVLEVGSHTGSEVTVDFFGGRRPGALPFAHPLIQGEKQILEELSIKPKIDPSISELSAFLDRNIPALTLGISKGDKHNDARDFILIDPIYEGITQLIGLILAIDNGLCDGNR
jgi:hypothetical protein